MAKIDRVKEFINYLKVILVFLLVTSIGLIGWLVSNYGIVNEVLIYANIIITVIILAICILINKKIIKNIKSLEDL